MWVIVFDAVDDFGIKEINDITRNHNHDLGPPQISPSIDDVKMRVFDEALRGASRIAGLVGFYRLAPTVVFIFSNNSFRLGFWNRTSIWSVLSSSCTGNFVLNILNQTEVRSCCNVGALPPLRLSPREVGQARGSELCFWAAAVQLRL
jgi:hypothetical protein